VTLPDGTTEIAHLAAHGGWLSLKEINDIGEPHYEHLDCTRIQRHDDKKGFRFYAYFQASRHVRRAGDLRPAVPEQG